MLSFARRPKSANSIVFPLAAYLVVSGCVGAYTAFSSFAPSMYSISVAMPRSRVSYDVAHAKYAPYTRSSYVLVFRTTSYGMSYGVWFALAFVEPRSTRRSERERRSLAMRMTRAFDARADIERRGIANECDDVA